VRIQSAGDGAQAIGWVMKEASVSPVAARFVIRRAQGEQQLRGIYYITNTSPGKPNTF
jgi:hypothetical protein